jgi:hypothetical protein
MIKHRRIHLISRASEPFRPRYFTLPAPLAWLALAFAVVLLFIFCA